MGIKKIIASVAVLCACFGVCGVSCDTVRENRDNCPPASITPIDQTQAKLIVELHARNYDNAAEVGERVFADNLPLGSFVSSLVLRNHITDTDTYAAYDEVITPSEMTHLVSPLRLADNVNRLMAIANGPVASEYSTLQQTVTLHPGGVEGADIYVGYEEVTHPLAADENLIIYRTKGQLAIEPVGLPADTRSMDISISGIYSTADRGTRDGAPTYGGTTSVSKSFAMAATRAEGDRYYAILAPSVGVTSPLSIVFTFADGSTETIALDVTMARNHITLVRPQYNPVERIWTIEVMVNGAWRKVDNLTISD